LPQHKETFAVPVVLVIDMESILPVLMDVWELILLTWSFPSSWPHPNDSACSLHECRKLSNKCKM